MLDDDLKYAAIRYYSFENQWLDILVLVPLKFAKLAKDCIYQALEVNFWDSTDDRFYSYGYLDYVFDELDKHDIPSSAVYLEQFEEYGIPYDKYIKYICKSDCKYIDIFEIN